MKKNISYLGIGTLALLLGVGLFTGTANAYQGDPSVQGPNYTPERHAAMEKAFETNDYTAWKNLMGTQGRVTSVITKDNFARFAEAHRLAEKGDLAGAQKIRQELGLGLHNGQGKNTNAQGRGMKKNTISVQAQGMNRNNNSTR